MNIMRAIVAVICPLVCMMTMASARPDNGVNEISPVQAGTAENEILTEKDTFFFYQARGVYKPNSQCTYKYNVFVDVSRVEKGYVVCSAVFGPTGYSPLLGEFYFHRGGGNIKFKFPLSERHKMVKVSAYNMDTFHPKVTGDVIAERLTAYIDFYPMDKGKTTVRVERTQLHRSDLAEYSKWCRVAERQHYRDISDAKKGLRLFNARTWKERTENEDRLNALYRQYKEMKNKKPL